MLIIDPTQGGNNRDATMPTARASARIGGKVCLLSNAKPNASALLTGVAARFGQLQAAPLFTKPGASRPASPELLDRIAKEFDAVLVAIGD